MNNGKLMWPPPAPVGPPAPTPKPAAVTKTETTKKIEPISPFNKTLKDALVTTTGVGGILGLGVVAPNADFTSMLTTFSLAGIVGYHTVWGVTPALHSPLMSVTNAISGITAVGGMLMMGGGYYPTNAIEVSLKILIKKILA